jgi:hypothetical protein
MPRAGWCRECGEWVWVDDEGACQDGHGPECVGNIYEAKAQNPDAAPEAGFGVGEMPDDLYRFSWAAFTLPFFWGIAYGVWPILVWWLVSLMLPLLLASLLGVTAQNTPVSVLVGITVVGEAVNGIVRLWAGANGHSLLWRKEAFRLNALSGSRPRFGVRRFKGRQRFWVILGWVLLLAALIASVIMNYVQWKEYGLAIAGATEPLVFMGAEVWLGVWLSVKMREERPGLPGPAEEPAEHSA